MLDITKPPYNITIPWTLAGGGDASAPDYWAPLQQAANDLAAGNAGLIDTYGGDGGRILMPPWAVSIGQKLVLPDGVSLQGHSKASSTLIMRHGFNPAHHFIDLGDSTSGHASFGGQIKQMHITSQSGILANSGSFMVYSNNVQDTHGIVSDCIIDGGSHFGGIKYMEGRGGASLIHFNDLVVNSRKAAFALGNVPMVIKVSGSTMVEIDGFEPVVDWINDSNPGLGAISGSYGLIALGGSYKIKRVHGEKVQNVIYFGEYGGSGPSSPPTDNNNQAHVEFFTGGGGNTKLIWIDSVKWKGRLTLDHIMLKTPSIPYSLYSTVPGVSHITTDIIDRIRV